MATNRLNRAQSYQVFKALSNEDTKNSTWPDIIRLIKEKTLLVVTKPMIEGVFQDFEIPKPVRKAKPVKVKDNTDRLIIVARAVIALYKDLRVQVPTDLQDVANRTSIRPTQPTTTTHEDNGAEFLHNSVQG